MKIIKNGICKTIDTKEWGQYANNGWRKSGCSEPQPSQDGLIVVDDYTISRLDNIQFATHV